MKYLKKLIASCLLFVVSLIVVTQASAHVVVKPDQAGIASFQTFTVGVPNEKDTQVTSLRLLIPNSLKSVSPNVKPGWTINVKKTGKGEDAIVTEIDWTGGSIPAGQRDDFLFSAQVPSTETTLSWKAYQTYADGTVVSWDQASNPNMSDEDEEKMEQEGKGPLSQTKIINDLKPTGSAVSDNSDKNNQTTKLALLISIAALALSAFTFSRYSSKK